uniref:Uncharacterized protein n=1 Tax=Avena sativa TaxID=4498 RepID=A0ACD5UXF4_AVESA
MQQQHKLPPRAPLPQGFGGGLTLFPMQGIGIDIGASSSSSQAAAAAAATSASASARAGEQMAYEDAWKASHPDFRTPFSSIEDATNRLIPYHVFAEYGEEDTDNGGTEEMSSEERWDKGVMEVVEKQIAEFEKQVLTFNVLSRKRSEERLMAERALLHDEHCATERLRATIIVQQERQQRRQQQEEAERASRLALAQAQAQVAGAWPLVQPTPSAWQQALAAVAASRGEVLVPVQVEAAAQSAAMHQQLDPATAGAWLMMHQQQQQQQQLLQHQQQQQQQQLLQQQLDLGAWPTYAAPHGGSSSMGQAGPSVVWQEQTGEQAMGGTAAGGNGMAQPWWMSGAQRREQ